MKKEADVGKKKGIARTNPAEGKSQPRAEGYEFAGARRTTGGRRGESIRLRERARNVP